jgi:large subunit ribosomal protein L22
MEVRAIAKYVKVQPRKVRIVADEIRGKNAAYSSALLRYHTSKGASALKKVLDSAMANAEENHGMSRDTLRIATIMVDEGPRLKRIQPRAMGRAYRILKKTSHITVVVEEADAEEAVRPHGTKAKARPTFAKSGGKKKASAKAEASPVTPDEATDTDAEETMAAQPEEATPVTESEAPEEAGSAGRDGGDESEAQASDEQERTS